MPLYGPRQTPRRRPSADERQARTFDDLFDRIASGQMSLGWRQLSASDKILQPNLRQALIRGRVRAWLRQLKLFAAEKQDLDILHQAARQALMIAEDRARLEPLVTAPWPVAKLMAEDAPLALPALALVTEQLDEASGDVLPLAIEIYTTLVAISQQNEQGLLISSRRRLAAKLLVARRQACSQQAMSLERLYDDLDRWILNPLVARRQGFLPAASNLVDDAAEVLTRAAADRKTLAHASHLIDELRNRQLGEGLMAELADTRLVRHKLGPDEVLMATRTWLSRWDSDQADSQLIERLLRAVAHRQDSAIV